MEDTHRTKRKVQRKLSAGCLLFHGKGKKRKYLLLHYGAGHWDFVKGEIEEGERPLETALRELEEETGIKKDQVRQIPGFKEKIHFMFRDKWTKSKVKPLISKYVYFFLFESKTTKVKLSEHTDFTWLKYEEAVEKATFKTAKDLLRKAEAFLNRSFLNRYEREVVEKQKIKRKGPA